MIPFIDILTPFALGSLLVVVSISSIVHPRLSLIKSVLSFALLTGSAVVFTYAAIHALIMVTQVRPS